MESNLVFVTGATGFVGNYLIRELVKNNYNVTIFARRTSNLNDLVTLPIKIVYGDFLKKNDIGAGLQQNCVVIHLAALLKNATYAEYYNAHVESAQNLISVCKEKNVSRVIVLSSTECLAYKRTAYGETKRIADLLFKASGLNVTFLQPDFIYGLGGRGFSTVSGMVKNLPLIPVFGDGLYRKQPIHVADVVQAILQILKDDTTIGKTYIAAGNDALSFNEIIATIQTALCVNKPVIRIPKQLCYFLAYFLKPIKNAPLTKDSLDGLFHDSNFDIIPLKNELKVNPICFKEGVKRSLF